MTIEKYGFAFDSDDFVDVAMMGGDDDESSFSTPRASGVAKRSTRGAEELAREAENEMKEMQALLGKLRNGTATRDEMAKLKVLNAKMSLMRKDLEKSAMRDSPDRELKSLRAESKDKARELLRTFKEKEVRSVIRAVCAAESVDLAFIIDCTSSMSPHIENVKTSIKAIVRQINSTNGNLRLRLAVVAYLDFTDGSDRFEVMDFVSSITEFEDFVGKLRAIGGADAPEDMAGGVQKANRLSWSHPTRVVFLIADAPCHGREFHKYDDTYPLGTPGINIVNELEALQKCCSSNGTMSIHFGRIGSGTDSMVSLLGSKYGIDLEVVAVEDSAKLTSTVTTSVRRSIFKTMTVAGPDKKLVSFSPTADIESLMDTIAGGGGSRAAKLKCFSLVTRVPSASEWARCPALKVNVYRNSKIRSMHDLKLPIGCGLLMINKLVRRRTTEGSTEPEHNTMFIRRASNPFAQGEIRIAFHGQLACTTSEL